MFSYPLIVNEKKKIRREVLGRRNALPVANRVLHSAAILEALFGLEAMRLARWVNFYVSHGSEVETQGMITHALMHGKRVAVPKMEGPDRIILSEIGHPIKELAPGSRGIPEPRPEFVRPVDLDEMDLLIVPGVAFDEKGRRLGRGGGGYDRFLARASGRIPIVGLAFELQILPAVPAAEHDVPVDRIVTEKRIIEVRAVSRRTHGPDH